MTAAAIDTTGLTLPQVAALKAIGASLERGISPSYEELRQALGLRSKSGISALVKALALRGKIFFTPRIERSIVLAPAGGPPRYALPPELQAWLEAWCLEHHDAAADVVADAVRLHRDEIEGAVA